MFYNTYNKYGVQMKIFHLGQQYPPKSQRPSNKNPNTRHVKSFFGVVGQVCLRDSQIL